MLEAKIAGADFKEMVAAVTRFPSVGTFAGSELITLQVKEGRAIVSAFRLVIARVSAAAEGELPPIAIGERVLGPWASGICKNQSPVTLKLGDDKILRLQTRGREITPPFVEGQSHKVPLPEQQEGLTVNDTVARRLAYLSVLAMNDPSRPELACVMLSGGKALACSQKSVAVLDCSLHADGDRTALPLPLAKVLRVGDLVLPGEKQTIMKSGTARFMMPSPVIALKSFPVAVLLAFGEMARKPVARCSGSKLAAALDECAAVLNGVARTEVVATLTFADGKLSLVAENGGVRFRRVFAVEQKLNATLRLPVEEVLRAAPLFVDKDVTVSKGKNGECFISFKGGFVLFPAWADRK